MYMNLNQYPSASRTYTIDFPKLTGGLNLCELDYRLSPDQTPDVRNLWWQDGVLQCRDGQVYLTESTNLGVGRTCYGSLFWGHAFFHIGRYLYYADMTASTCTLTRLCDINSSARGTFFRYQDWLFYKTAGAYVRISYIPDGSPRFKAEGVDAFAYTPVILINTDPETGSGDTYQPENRLSAAKTVRYTAKSGATKYRLPIKGVRVTKVVVDGEEKVENTDYTADATMGWVTFTAAPPVTDPPTSNTVEITFEKANDDASKSVMDCTYAMVSGGDQSLCILMAGCEKQPNAVFWNSNDNLSMNPGYFPFSYYNLVGDTEDPVSGFGRQYSDTIVLKHHSVGKLDFTTQTIDGRESISFTYTNINSKVGCDLPWSIQLIENNLVFCNTYQGVHVIRSSSAAYENNVECISRNVNGSRDRGLLTDVRSAPVVTSFDDDDRYWLCAGDKVYLWDYVLSTASEPSWFFFNNVPGVAYFQDDEHRKYHLDSKGRVTRFDRVFSDYDAGIEKVYQFPTQDFGSYERLKDVVSVLVAARSDTDTDINILYETDYETRADLTCIRSYSWRLFPRNLTRRCLSQARYAHTERRKPGCRHIRHFAMRFSNNDVGCDLAVVSAQIFYKFQGKER